MNITFFVGGLWHKYRQVRFPILKYAVRRPYQTQNEILIPGSPWPLVLVVITSVGVAVVVAAAAACCLWKWWPMSQRPYGNPGESSTTQNKDFESVGVVVLRRIDVCEAHHARLDWPQILKTHAHKINFLINRQKGMRKLF